MTWIWMAKRTPQLQRRYLISADWQRPDVKPVHGYLKINAREPLISDNLLDLSHTEFLHPYLANDGFNSDCSRMCVKTEILSSRSIRSPMNR